MDQWIKHAIEEINNNWMDAKYRQMRSDRLDAAVVAHCLGIPGQTKVSGDRARGSRPMKFVV